MLKQPVPSKAITKAMLEGLQDVIYPQQLYTLELKDVKAGNMGRARLGAWRFTGKLAGRDMCVHVGHQIGGKAPAVSRLSYGAYVTKARDALKEVVKSKEARAHQYELRLLTIPALNVEAVWLKSKTGKDDLIFPYLPPEGLRAMRFYALDKFLDVVRPAAEERLKFDDSPRRLRRPG